jgi:hypothetical protein
LRPSVYYLLPEAFEFTVEEVEDARPA